MKLQRKLTPKRKFSRTMKDIKMQNGQDHFFTF